MRLTERLTAQHGALLVVDTQEKLLAVMQDREPVIENIVRLVRGAREMEMPVWATEQYPRGLGPTVPAVAALIPCLFSSAVNTFSRWPMCNSASSTVPSCGMR